MKKIAYVFDSSSSIKNDQYEDVFVVPLVITEKENDIKTFYDGVDLFHDELAKMLFENKNVGTSLANIHMCINLLDDLTSKYDEIYVFPIPRTLSSNYNTWVMISQDYKNVFVFEQYFVSAFMEWMLSDFKRKEKDGSLDVEYVKKYIEDTKKTMCGLLIVPDITFLKKGGRVSNFKAALIKLLKLNLLITLDYNGLKFCDKAKNIEQAITKAKKILKQKINFSNETLNRVRILLNKNADKKFLIDDIFLETKKSFNFSDNLEIAEIPSVIMVHTGPNYFVICLDCSKKN